MIAALFALAAAMLIAGVTAVVEGFPYVRLESGMAMVYGGSVVGSSGVLLFGLAVVATWLRRVEKALRLHQGLAPVEAVPATPAGGQEIDPLRELTASTLGGTLADRTRIEPSLAEPSRAAALEIPAPTREPAPTPAEPELPLPGLGSSHPAAEPSGERPAVQDAPKADPADDLFVPSRPAADKPEPIAAAPEQSETALRSSLDEAPAAGPERTVVGRYSSGGNTYLMYDDGTIEADTPNGRFTFASLDELKAFVDGGGEAGARGAA